MNTEPLKLTFLGVKDSSLEIKMRMYDPNLRLVMNRITGEKAVFEFHPNGDEPKFLFYLRDDDNDLKIINRLQVMMMKHEEKKKMGVDAWVDSQRDESLRLQEEGIEKLKEETEYRVKHDHLAWRKAMRELNNEVGSDVFAGFPKGTNNYDSQKENRITEAEVLQPDAGVVQDTVQ